jgi:hypothetical protein
MTVSNVIRSIYLFGVAILISIKDYFKPPKVSIPIELDPIEPILVI